MAKKTEPVAPAQTAPPAAPAEGATITDSAPDAGADAKDADQDANATPDAAPAATPAADPAPITPAAAPAAPSAPAEAPKAAEVKKPAAGAKVVFTQDSEEADGYVKQGYLVRLMRHEGVMGYKVFLTQKVHALGQGDSPVSKA